MKNQLGIIVLILIAVGLSIGLIWSQKTASTQKTRAVERIGFYSNKLISTSATLEDQRKVNMELESDRARQKATLVELTNNLARVSTNLEQTQASLESARKDVAARENRISELENQNQQLDQRALDLSASITNLTGQIADTRRRLAASEGDKETLTKELQRLMSEKAELERQFNDLAAMRAQVAKLRAEMNVSRRLDWIRRGLFANSQRKGAELLMQNSLAPAERQPPTPAYDLNVEVSADGTVRVIQPSTNSAAATNPAPAQ